MKTESPKQVLDRLNLTPEQRTQIEKLMFICMNAGSGAQQINPYESGFELCKSHFPIVMKMPIPSVWIDNPYLENIS